MAEQPIRIQAMSKRKDGQATSESTALVEYRVPAMPAPVPTVFKADVPAFSVPALGAPPSESGPSEVEPFVIDAPTMPRAASLEEPPTIDVPTMSASPSIVPDEAALPPRGGDRPPIAGTAQHGETPPSRSSRFTLLAASVALAAGIGAVAGSLGDAELHRHLPGAAAAPHLAASDDIQVLKDTVAQLRASVKTLADNVTAMRTSFTASSSTVNGQLSKITEVLDRVDHRPAAPVAAPEVTASIAAPASAEPKPRPPVVEGWAIRKVYDGAALIEGRHGIVEVEPGMNLPGLGRIQEIRRQDGHWVVVTPKGLIMPVH
jgi:hypothetical protein